ncbi:MAG: M50 family metallopeptidase [Clostridia bacterium]|nr:M50 family metallopeptidase [Clostridia bacterium]
MRYAAYITAAVLGVACAALVIVFCAYAYAWWIIAVALAVVIFIPVGSWLHELGHKFFGAMAHVKTRMHYSVFGSTYCDVWTDRSKGLRSRLAATALGGPVINLLFIILGIIALCVHAVPVCISFVLPASVYLFVLNVFPCTLGDGDTDGMVALGLIRMDDEAKVTLAVMAVQADVESGTPLSEIQRERLEDLPQIQEDSPAYIALLQLKEQYYAAAGDADAAAKCRERLDGLKEYVEE